MMELELPYKLCGAVLVGAALVGLVVYAPYLLLLLPVLIVLSALVDSYRDGRR